MFARLKLSHNPDLNKIALIGKMRSGKDTLGKYLCEKYGYKRYAFGDEVKRYYHELFGQSKGKPRKAYQWFGQTMRQHDPDIWVNKVFEKIAAEKPKKIVITDCRQPNEYERLVKENFLMVRIVCNESIRIERMIRAGDEFALGDLRHETESALDDYPVHIVIKNEKTIEEMIKDFEYKIKLYTYTDFY